MASNGAVQKELQIHTLHGKEYKLLHREKMFAMAYVQNNGNASQAAVTAGYSAKTRGEIGAELLRRPRILEYIQAIQADLALQLGISAIDIAREYAKIGFSDYRKVFDPETHQILEAKDFDDNTAAAVSSFEVTEIYEPRTGKFIGKNKKLKFHSKIEALDKLARMIGVDAKLNKLEAPKPEPLQIEITHSPTKIKKGANNTTIPGTTEE